MSTIEQNLLDDEKITNLMIKSKGPVIIKASIAAGFYFLNQYIFGNKPSPLALIFLWLAYSLIMEVFKYLGTELVITNKRVISKYGFFSQTLVHIDWNRVESITMNQPFFGRFLNYGTVLFSGVGGEHIGSRFVTDPAKFRAESLSYKDELNQV